jgi:predicted dehydrogenase
MANPIYRTAVVGLGIGKQHLAAYKALPHMFDVRALCSLESEANEALAQQLNIPITHTKFEDVLAMPDVDIVNICTPPYLHYPMAKAALLAGKHVICEKPLCANVREVDDLIATELKTGKCLMPIFQYRFGAGLQKLRWLKNKGLTGNAYVASIEVHWRRRPEYYTVAWRGKWATELGGAVTGHAIHALDMLTYILGPVESVFAYTSTMVNDIENEDCASATLKLKNGALATLSLTLGSNVEISRHRFVFANLTAESNTRAYTSSGDPWQFSPDTPMLAPAITEALAEYDTQMLSSQPATTANAPQTYTAPASFHAQFEQFYHALVNHTALPVTTADAYAAIALINAIYQSANTGEMVRLM